MTPEEKYAKLAELRDTGDYVVIVARINNGKVVWTRPRITVCGPGVPPRGQDWAEAQLKIGLSAVDHSTLRGSEGAETYAEFAARFAPKDA